MNQGYPQSLELSEQLWADGERLLELAEEAATWVKRRIDRIEFDDDRTFCRTTTLDIDLSPDQLALLPMWRGRSLLPVQLLTRGRDVDATLRDSRGEPMPQLTRRHERSLVAAGLLQFYSGDLLDPNAVFDAIRREIDHEVFAPSPDSPHDLDTGDRVFLTQVKRFARRRYLIAAVDLRDEADGAGGDDPSEEGALFRLVVTHSEPLPAQGWRAERIRLKRVARVAGRTAYAKESPTGSGMKAWWRRFVARRRASIAGRAAKKAASVPTPDTFTPRLRDRYSDDYRLKLPVDQIQGCESYHFELIAPQGTFPKEALLMVREVNPPDAKRGLAIQQAIQKQLEGGPSDNLDALVADLIRDRTIKTDDPHPDRAHIFYPNDPGSTRQVSEAAAYVVLRPMTVGMMRSGTWASMLATIVIAVSLVTIGWTGSAIHIRVAATVYRPDQNSVVALILLGPTLLLAVILREGEHLMAKRAVYRHRLRVAVLGSTTFLAAAVYAAGVPARATWWILVVLFVLSASVTAQTVLSYWRSDRFLNRPRRPAEIEG